MITTDKILAHKVHGKNLILLKQVGNSYFVLLAQVTRAKKGLFSAFTALGSFSSNSSLKILAQREISIEEAQALYAAFTSTQNTSATYDSNTAQLSAPTLSGSTTPIDQTINSDVLLLAGSTADDKPVAQKIAFKPTVSPYFPTKDIFLSVQKTRAPATI